jgi:hypothetical protein
MKKLNIIARILPDGRPLTIVGRDAWALRNLFNSGRRGCTPISTPGPRWSHYVWKLRGFGFVIETIHESHGGQFAGTHAKYILRSEIEILRESDKQEAA